MSSEPESIQGSLSGRSLDLRKCNELGFVCLILALDYDFLATWKAICLILNAKVCGSLSSFLKTSEMVFVNRQFAMAKRVS